MKEKKFENAVLFTGLPGIGLVGKICVDYLLKQFKCERIAEIYSDSFPPSVQTNKGILEIIKDDLYHFSFNKRDFIFLAGPVQPMLDVKVGSAQEHYEFANSLLGAFKELGVSEIYTLAGINIGEKRMHSEPRVIVAATSKKMLESLVDLGAVNDRPIGMISGAAGLLLGIAKSDGIEGACLMGETSANLIYGDPGAAKKVVELLVKKFGFKVEMKRMEKEAREIEEAFSSLAKQFSETEEQKPTGLSYVR